MDGASYDPQEVPWRQPERTPQILEIVGSDDGIVLRKIDPLAQHRFPAFGDRLTLLHPMFARLVTYRDRTPTRVQLRAERWI